MRKSDKLKNFKKANLLAENRYLESKGFINENLTTQDSLVSTIESKLKEIEKGSLPKEVKIGEYLDKLKKENSKLYSHYFEKYKDVIRLSKIGLDEVNAFDDYEQDHNQHEEIKYISPERKNEIETLANTYELTNVKVDKGVGGLHGEVYVRLEFYKMIDDKPKYFWVNIIKDDVKIDGKENLQSMIPDDTKRHEFMMKLKSIVNSILENELA